MDLGFGEEGALASSSANRQRRAMIYPGSVPCRAKPYLFFLFLIDDGNDDDYKIVVAIMLSLALSFILSATPPSLYIGGRVSGIVLGCWFRLMMNSRVLCVLVLHARNMGLEHFMIAILSWAS
jgi:hypothetical protein